ncbi:MAG: 3-oxoacyl-[acyl-carrier-protein] reductase [Candidatus Cellulosilyticum pullistercoris]|uniref:3-oxoacyl-[acyl-carrier-protein] reductase n=1 Tax=Candidatus Cellulosilyticum pullistercoris TaxID=2838521 RepID=A0A9E2KBX8_9FIRM|nr:3-oxoacyl-[acyl-carrier-protein] reductase [Candidatus Cellulosilyticum pullistercoris]
MLKGKVALITGSVRGIGKAISLCFAKAGADIVINYTSDSSEVEAKKLVEELEQMGVKVLAIKADVSKSEEAKALITEAIKSFGKLDILVNNAGITKDMLLLRMTEQEFDKVIEVNLKGIFNCTKEASRAMMKTGGSIINMTSVVGLSGNAGQSNYAASKAGVIGFTKSVAKEFAGKKLRVNAIAPGFINTDMTNVLTDKVKEDIMRNIPMKRFGSSDEVAKVALFLASDLSSYVTGEVIRVDGGMAM